MALSDSHKMANVRRTKRKSLTARKSTSPFSDEQKIELVQLYILTGNLKYSARQLKIVEQTAQGWKATDWWKSLEADLRSQGTLVLGAKLKKIAETSVGVVADRLENGDYKLNVKTGEVVRVPVSLRDAHRVMIDAVNVSQDLEAKAVVVKEMDESVNAKLDMLALRFAELANKVQSKPEVVVTDIIYSEGETSHAVHDQREEGLQEATEVRLETSGEESPGRADDPTGQNDPGRES